MTNKTWLKRTSLVVITAAILLSMAACNRTSPEEKAAQELLKAFEGNDPAVLEKALLNAGPAGLASLTSSSASPGGDFTYEFATNDQWEDPFGSKTIVGITKYTGNGGLVIVPDKIDGFPVIGIDSRAFAGNYSYGFQNFSLSEGGYFNQTRTREGTGANIKAIILPDTITVIADSAFRGCINLHTINIPAELKTIQDGAFDGCTNLYNLTIPDSITELEWLLFTRDELDRGVSDAYTNIAFKGCGKLKFDTRNRLKELGYTGKF